MNKGKIKAPGNKHLSIVLIPHSSSQVKVFKFTSFYGKLFAAFLLISVVLAGTVLFVTHLTSENRELKNHLNELYSNNTEQRKLLDEKAGEITQLKESDEVYRKMVAEKTDEITRKFNEITDKYISNQSSSRTSRSGERTVTGFSEELSSLEDIIDSLNNLSSRTDVISLDLSEANAKLEKYFETVPTLVPIIGEFNNGFGYRKDPFTKKKAFHEGLDISADKGTNIKAAASGKVTLSKRYGGYGLAVIIDHGRGISTLYAHSSKLIVKEGQTVKKGDIIAKVGSTGRSTGPHLHFEVWLYNTPVDPKLYLDIKN